MTDDNCLGYALKIADKRYSALITILPLIFIVIELIRVNADINNSIVDIYDNIRTARTAACIVSALAFAGLAIGGLVKYIKSKTPFKDSRTIWWIVTGIEGILIFTVLAVFQFRDVKNNAEIYESVFFWIIMSLVVGMLIWFALKGAFMSLSSSVKGKGKLIVIPDDEIIVSIKLTAMIAFTIWISYRPTNPKYVDAGAVIVIITLILALVYALMMKGKQVWIPLITWTLLPAIVIFTSWYKSDEEGKETLQYVYLVALLIALVVYLGLIIGFFIESRKKQKDDINTNIV